MLETTQPRIERALDIVDREVEYTAAEERAFRRFQTRLERIDVRNPTGMTGGGALGGPTVALAAEEPSTGAGLQAVRTAYRETVMAVPHFEAEYGESLRENLAGEFGAELATRVVEGAQFTPVVRESLIAACGRATTERSRFLDALRDERESLATVRDSLDEIERRAETLGSRICDDSASPALSAVDAALADLETDCESLAETRQQFLHTRSVATLSGVDETSLVQFLYGDCDACFPALTDVTACLDTVRRHRQRCLR